MLKTRIELPSVEEYLKQQDEAHQKEDMANHLMNLQNSMYINAGLSSKDVLSIANNTQYDLSNPREYQEAIDYIASIKSKVEKHIDSVLSREFDINNIDDIIFHYKYFRVMLLLVTELLERTIKDGRNLIKENQRLEQIAKPRLDSLDTYRREIREQERVKAREIAVIAMSGIIPNPTGIRIANHKYNWLVKAEEEQEKPWNVLS